MPEIALFPDTRIFAAADVAAAPLVAVPVDPHEDDDAGGDGDGEGPLIPNVLPILPLRGMVVFPGTITPIGVGRPSSRRLLDESLPNDKIIGLFAQKDEEEEDPGADGIHHVGTAAMVLKLIRQPDETVTLIVHGLRRRKLIKLTQTDPFLRGRLATIKEKQGSGAKFNALVRELRTRAEELIELTPNTPDQAQAVLHNITEPGPLADFLAANLDLTNIARQALLEEHHVERRIHIVHRQLVQQLEMLQLQQKIHRDVHETIGENQRKFFLREQLKAIRTELGEGEEGVDTIVEELRDRLEEADPPEAVMEEAQRDLRRLEAIPSASPEYSMTLTYLELLADLPWSVSSEETIDLDEAQRVLDRDHFDLDKVKRRLIEYLAVRKLNPEGRGPILCLVGPPGVGKTSLGQSVADALGREFVRLALGGIRDEAEIRGHRRTYIGAMPGRIIQELRRAGTNNPVVMLDEIDKLGSDFRGDPSSALLEVLDPRQNNTFTDRYLDVPFDLSNILFICTANYFGNVPAPLQDRLETIEVPGYSEHDKVEIARKYLVPRQIKENGLKISKAKWRVGAIRFLIEHYTREAGVRELERQIGAVCRGLAAQIAGAPHHDGEVEIKDGKVKIDEKVVRKVLGPEKYVRELENRTERPGVALGLAYTSVGGEVLFVEATSYPGKGNVTLTGQIGDVMKESAQAAMSLFKTRAASMDGEFDVKKLAEMDVHIHVPAGAVPKDGPSAGVAMFTAISSLMLDRPVKPRLAMTGEITLRGKVLPIGGLKEKSLAAARADIKTVLIPQQNERDLEELDPRVRDRLTFIPIPDVEALLQHALA